MLGEIYVEVHGKALVIAGIGAGSAEIKHLVLGCINGTVLCHGIGHYWSFVAILVVHSTRDVLGSHACLWADHRLVADQDGPVAMLDGLELGHSLSQRCFAHSSLGSIQIAVLEHGQCVGIIGFYVGVKVG